MSKFLNAWEIDQAMKFYKNHPVLGPAAQTLANLRDASNANSDGWHSWPKPANAAAKVMDLIDPSDNPSSFHDLQRKDATFAKYKAALVPLKRFRTTHPQIQFEIVEAKKSLLYKVAIEDCPRWNPRDKVKFIENWYLVRNDGVVERYADDEDGGLWRTNVGSIVPDECHLATTAEEAEFELRRKGETR